MIAILISCAYYLTCVQVPITFLKVLLVEIAYFHGQNVWIYHYLDYFLILAQSRIALFRHQDCVHQTLLKLDGECKEKPVNCEYLGMFFNIIH